MTDIHTATKDFSALQVNVEDGFVIARMNRPEVRNAIDETMVEEFHTLCGILERDPQILVVTGCVAETSKGPRGIFASGADIAQLRERRREDALRGINSGVFHRIAKLPSPVIAAIDGFALGGGLELALAADFRLATPGAKFGQPEANLGIIAGAGALWRLKEAVGNPLAKEILLTGRVLTGEEAAQSHLVNELFEPEELENGAREWAKKIAALDPLAVRLSKQLFDMPVEAHPAIDNIAQAVLFESEAKFDRMQAFLDRKKK
ncbi:enoyl-CoA hydratase/isomerase family protein [Corynebacterium sp.]|uniref:enoyl-CoA hydratase/isomerase family protein n=1 Tax=Corynebacterium sp. TaxID=1720 RepID=UPI002649D1F2|nr:enoyl-CoA hydratase/isomerase family protein [Corynebacterium sp.]MDN6136318.1 enoyl-CoA hydratase/isomerase family protein [Corynebacterium sp.]MDN6737979.1 enoyl-CoA hydratase/isomerase family protein [Corynebacterium sp.]